MGIGLSVCGSGAGSLLFDHALPVASTVAT